MFEVGETVFVPEVFAVTDPTALSMVHEPEMSEELYESDEDSL